VIFGNCRLWRGGEGFVPGALVVDGDVLSAIEDGDVRGDVDLEGRCVVPGLIDAHFHLQQLGESLRTVRLEGTTSEAQAVQRITRAPAGTWILGGGWDDNRWESRALPTRASVAGVTRPMLMTRVDFHAAWVNDAALAIAGIDSATADPPGGKIVRDSAGAPTGVLVDAAVDLVAAHVPPLSRQLIEQDIVRAMERCARVGITCVHDMMMSAEALAVLVDLERRGELRVRVRAYMHSARGASDSDWLRVMGEKLFADGALGSRGAALRAPYSDDPHTSGLLLMTFEELRAAARRVHDSGQQLAIHAIGDRAADLAVAAIAEAQGASVGRRHRIEHAQTVAPELFEQFARAGIIASMQPSHCTCDLSWAKARLGPSRIAGAYAWRSFLGAGVHLALGSDAPIADENPWDGIRSAVARTDALGDTITPEQRLTLREALLGYTEWGAYASRDERLGRLAPGMLADFVVLDRDPFATAAEDLASVRVVKTVVGGKVTFSA